MSSELFVIDLTSCSSSGEIIVNVSAALETVSSTDKNVVLKLGDISLNQGQLLSIQSLIASYGAQLAHIETLNVITKDICIELGIQAITSFKSEPLAQSEEIGFIIGEKEEHQECEKQEENFEEGSCCKMMENGEIVCNFGEEENHEQEHCQECEEHQENSENNEENEQETHFEQLVEHGEQEEKRNLMASNLLA